MDKHQATLPLSSIHLHDKDLSSQSIKLRKRIRSKRNKKIVCHQSTTAPYPHSRIHTDKNPLNKHYATQSRILNKALSMRNRLKKICTSTKDRNYKDKIQCDQNLSSTAKPRTAIQLIH